jgi:hypothetical protein
LLVKEGRDSVGTLIRLIKSPLCDGSLTQIIIFFICILYSTPYYFYTVTKVWLITSKGSNGSVSD